jgi:hypothetical protein
MNKSKVGIWCTAMLLLLIAGVAQAGSDEGLMNGPHAKLYLNVSQRAKQIYPVEIWKIDGKLTNHRGVMWIVPGDYTFSVKVSGKVNVANLPGFQTRPSLGPQEHTLKLKVEAGKAYYIGAKFSSAGNWEPVVWKTENSNN